VANPQMKRWGHWRSVNTDRTQGNRPICSLCTQPPPERGGVMAESRASSGAGSLSDWSFPCQWCSTAAPLPDVVDYIHWTAVGGEQLGHLGEHFDVQEQRCCGHSRPTREASPTRGGTPLDAQRRSLRKHNRQRRQGAVKRARTPKESFLRNFQLHVWKGIQELVDNLLRKEK